MLSTGSCVSSWLAKVCPRTRLERLARENALAYFASSSVTKKNNFIILTLGWSRNDVTEEVSSLEPVVLIHLWKFFYLWNEATQRLHFIVLPVLFWNIVISLHWQSVVAYAIAIATAICQFKHFLRRTKLCWLFTNLICFGK